MDRVWGRYFGGGTGGLGNDAEETFEDLEIEGSAVLLSGWTRSWDLPVTPDAFWSTYGDWTDAMFVALDVSDGSEYFVTYIAGTGESGDWGQGVAGTYGQAAVAGHTTSHDLATREAHDTTYNTGVDAFFMLIRMFST